jgi:hypothetical protein
MVEFFICSWHATVRKAEAASHANDVIELHEQSILLQKDAPWFHYLKCGIRT